MIQSMLIELTQYLSYTNNDDSIFESLSISDMDPTMDMVYSQNLNLATLE